MYFIKLEDVTKVKISKKDWEEFRIRELAYAWTKQIRTFMMFRMIVYGLGSMMENRGERNMLAVVSFLFDIYILFVLISMLWMKPKQGVRTIFVHGNPIIPTMIQVAHLVAFVVAWYFEYQDDPAFGYFGQSHDTHDKYVYNT
jgi:hypothetical protein